MEPIKLGIVGCGVIGTNHVKNATKSPLVELGGLPDYRL